MGTLIGLIFGGGLFIATQSFAQRKQQHDKVKISETFWPQYCDEIASAIRAGLSVQESVWQSAGSLPLALRVRFNEVEKECLAGMSFQNSLDSLQMDLESATFSRIVHLIIISQNQNAGAIAALLNEFAQNLRSDIALINEIAGKQAVTRVSAKVAAFAPLVVLFLTSTRNSVRQTFLTPTGLFVVGAALSIAFISYLMMTKISKIKVLDA